MTPIERYRQPRIYGTGPRYAQPEAAMLPTLSAPELTSYCRTCKGTRVCAHGAPLPGDPDTHPWRCTVCGRPPHETPAHENVPGRQWGVGVLATLGDEA